MILLWINTLLFGKEETIGEYLCNVGFKETFGFKETKKEEFLKIQKNADFLQIKKKYKWLCN